MPSPYSVTALNLATFLFRVSTAGLWRVSLVDFSESFIR
jgi:hypothetical protein